MHFTLIEQFGLKNWNNISFIFLHLIIIYHMNMSIICNLRLSTKKTFMAALHETQINEWKQPHIMHNDERIKAYSMIYLYLFSCNSPIILIIAPSLELQQRHRFIWSNKIMIFSQNILHYISRKFKT